MRAFVLVSTVLALAVGLAGCDGTDSSAPRPTPSALTAGRVDPAVRTARSVQTVRAQLSALRRSRAADYADTWAGGAQARGLSRTVAANTSSMGVALLRAVAVPASLRQTVASSPGSGAAAHWTLDIDLTWRSTREPAATARSRLTYTFRTQRHRAVVTAIAPMTGSQTPLWLLQGLRVATSAHAVAAAGDAGTAADLLARLVVARRDIGRIVKHWHGQLTAVIAPTTADFATLLPAGSADTADAAAVTTTVDGADTATAPVEIAVNPRIWPTLSPVGAKVVITHEAAHAATGSVTSDAPLWLTEGFADFVAVRSADVPVAVSSAAAIAEVRTHGLPDRLPTNGDFAVSNPRPESAYELSRLAVQAIARHDGITRLVAFYSAVVAHPASLEAEMRRILHWSSPALTQGWRRLLVGLAGAQ